MEIVSMELQLQLRLGADNKERAMTYTCRKEIWSFFLRRMKQNVSAYSSTFEK